MRTRIHDFFDPLKRVLPRPIANGLRNTITALAAPSVNLFRMGHFKSSFAMRAIDNAGNPLPWYTYPCIDMLRFRGPFPGKTVLEFGAGQSTYWWAQMADTVFSLESDAEWLDEVKQRAPVNVEVRHTPATDADTIVATTRKALETLGSTRFDIAVIDGKYRRRMLPFAMERLNQSGAIICDNSEGFSDAMVDNGWSRVDFYGLTPGVFLPHCTSILFKGDCFLFDNAKPVGFVAVH